MYASIERRSMAMILINGQELEIGDDERLNGIEAAKRLGIEIPHYCWHPGLSVVASCRMCLVETGRRDSEDGRDLDAAQAGPGLPDAGHRRHGVRHRQRKGDSGPGHGRRRPADSPSDRLPDLRQGGRMPAAGLPLPARPAERRADIKPFTSRRRPVGETVTLFVDRCVMCTRCVRFTREITGTSELMVVNRGAHEEIDVFPGHPLANKLSGNVVDLCPVGALGDKDFLYSQRVWFMKQHDGVCAGCSTGCSIYVEENQDRIYRLKPRENPHVNQWWICDEGRYGFKHVHSSRRTAAVATQQGGLRLSRPLEWSELPGELEARSAQGRPSGGGDLAAPDGRGGLLALPVLTPIRPRGLVGPRAGAGAGRGRDSFPAASRSAPRNVPTAGCGSDRGSASTAD